MDVSRIIEPVFDVPKLLHGEWIGLPGTRENLEARVPLAVSQVKYGLVTFWVT
jgi:hypothetical protein